MAEIAGDWLRDAPPERARLVRHACRTLVKRGHAPTLAALGYRAAAVVAELAVETPEVVYGGALAFTLDLRDAGGFEQRLVVDYAIHHRRANGVSFAQGLQVDDAGAAGGRGGAAQPPARDPADHHPALL